MAIRFQIDDLIIDATPEVDFEADVETTDHPIEEGSDSTDHASVRPETITATCIVTNTPVDSTDREVRDATNSDWAKVGAKDSYSQQVYDRLVKMKNDRGLHVLTTVRGIFKNMLMTKLSNPTRASTGDGLQFRVAFKAIRIVTTGTAKFVATKNPKTRKATDADEQAKKQGKPSTEEEKQSLLSRLTGVGARN